MGGQTVTSQVGNAADVQNVNPFSQGMWQQLGNLQGQFAPTNNIANLQGVMPGIQSIVNQLISPVSQNMNETADTLANQAVADVASQYSNMGALNSGAALTDMLRKTQDVRGNVMTNIAGLQSQLGGGLLNSLLGQMGGAYQGGLQGQMQMAAPEWWQPTYMQSYQPGLLDNLFGAAGAAGGLMTGIGGLMTAAK
jgi:hypothetical protein